MKRLFDPTATVLTACLLGGLLSGVASAQQADSEQPSVEQLVPQGFGLEETNEETGQPESTARGLDKSEMLLPDGVWTSATPLVLNSPEDIVVLESELIAAKKLGKTGPNFGDWLGYNSTESDWTWLAARNDLGMFSMQSYPSISIGDTTSFEAGWGVHFLNGPNVTDMPPRLFDLEMALRTRRLLSDHMMVDLKLGTGVFTDFEGSSRKGVRFPSHAVGYYEHDHWLISVLGVDVLDRDDISVLPVFGAIWRGNQDLICELVFPRPKIQYRISETRSFYIAGELGGGTWAVERVGGIDDVATYRDIRITCGVMKWGDGDETVFEVGYAMDRALEYRSGRGDYEPDGALILRLRSHW
jgi:hypothetical protein